jgi:hypothetical protein
MTEWRRADAALANDHIVVRVTGPSLVTTRRHGVESEQETTDTAYCLVPLETIYQAARGMVTRWPELEYRETVNRMIVLLMTDPPRYLAEDRAPFLIKNLREGHIRAYARELGLPDPRRTGPEGSQPREVLSLNRPVRGPDIDPNSEVVDLLSNTVVDESETRERTPDGYQSGRSVNPQASAIAGDGQDRVDAWLETVAAIDGHAQEILHWVMADPRISNAEIGRRLGITGQRVGQIRAKIRAVFVAQSEDLGITR